MILTNERLNFVREKRKEAREVGFVVANDLIGEAAVSELKKLYDVYDEKIYIWLAGLWDKEIGAFYYSESARDTNLYRPDIESTVQVLRFLNNTGMIRAGRGPAIMQMPAELRNSIVGFAKSLQDRDGFFYHPQWGKDVSPSRRGRDFSWAKSILSETGESPIYPLPTDKGGDGKKSVTALCSREDNKRPKHHRLLSKKVKITNFINNEAPRSNPRGFLRIVRFIGHCMC
jgi:hypothetical protein